jgi:hypothetical protein
VIAVCCIAKICSTASVSKVRYLRPTVSIAYSGRIGWFSDEPNQIATHDPKTSKMQQLSIFNELNMLTCCMKITIESKHRMAETAKNNHTILFIYFI